MKDIGGIYVFRIFYEERVTVDSFGLLLGIVINSEVKFSF